MGVKLLVGEDLAVGGVGPLGRDLHGGRCALLVQERHEVALGVVDGMPELAAERVERAGACTMRSRNSVVSTRSASHDPSVNIATVQFLKPSEQCAALPCRSLQNSFWMVMLPQHDRAVTIRDL